MIREDRTAQSLLESPSGDSGSGAGGRAPILTSRNMPPAATPDVRSPAPGPATFLGSPQNLLERVIANPELGSKVSVADLLKAHPDILAAYTQKISQAPAPPNAWSNLGSAIPVQPSNLGINPLRPRASEIQGILCPEHEGDLFSRLQIDGALSRCDEFETALYRFLYLTIAYSNKLPYFKGQHIQFALR